MKQLLTLALLIMFLFSVAACAQNAKTKPQPKAKAQVKPADPVMEQVRIQVEKNKPSIVALYKKHADGTDMKGLVSITLYLADDGTVSLSDINPLRGNFSNSFLMDLENLTGGWTFNSARRVAYSFTMTLN